MKQIFTLLTTLCSCLCFGQQSKNASAVIQAEGATTWVSDASLPSALLRNDNVYLTSVIGTGKSARVLKLTNFDFNLPATATITGIRVTIERHAAVANEINDQLVQLIIRGNQKGMNKATSAFWATSDENISYGSNSDKWSLSSINPADINASDFGIAINAKSNSHGGAALIDAVSVTVYYTNSAINVRFVNFEAKKQASFLQLTWKVHEEDRLRWYEVERSTNGTSFEKIGTVPAADLGEYGFEDLRPLKGKSYYRIKSIDLDTKFGYSTVLSVTAGEGSVVLKAFPSLVQSELTIQHEDAANKSSIVISSADGRVMKNIVPPTGAQQTSVDLSSVKAGIYFVRFENGKGQVETLKIVKQ